MSTDARVFAFIPVGGLESEARIYSLYTGFGRASFEFFRPSYREERERERERRRDSFIFFGSWLFSNETELVVIPVYIYIVVSSPDDGKNEERPVGEG